MSFPLLNTVFRPKVTDRYGLKRYVLSATLLAWSVTLAVECAHQLYFFTSWATCWREWSMSTVEVMAVALPIAYSIGHAHLQLYRAKLDADRLGRTDPTNRPCQSPRLL